MVTDLPFTWACHPGMNSSVRISVDAPLGQLTVAASTPVAVTVQEFDVVEKKGRGSGIR
jgi:hypothetical protein